MRINFVKYMNASHSENLSQQARFFSKLKSLNVHKEGTPVFVLYAHICYSNNVLKENNI